MVIAAPTDQRPEELAAGASLQKPPPMWTDFAMLALAIVSVLLVGWISFFDVSPQVYDRLVLVDYAICAVFAAEFLWRWHRAGWPWSFPFIYWYEVLGMIPVTSPLLRGFRLLRIVVIVVRLARLADRVLGDRVTAKIVNNSVDTIVDAVKKPVTVSVLDEVATVLGHGHYAHNIAAAVAENRANLDSMIVDLVLNDPQTKRIRYIPFHDDIIRLISDTVFRMVLEMLADPRTDELIADVLRENIEQIRDALTRQTDAPPAAYGPASPYPQATEG